MLRLIFKSMKNRIVSILMVTVVCIISLMLVSMSIYIYENSIYCTKQINSIMKEKVENSAIIGIMGTESDEESEKSNAFRKVLGEMPEISAAGYTKFATGMDGCEYAEVQRKIKGNDDELRYLYLESEAADLYNIELEEGQLVKDMPNDDGLIYVYLGSAFKDYYSVGDESEWKVTEEIRFKFIVKGFFKDGVRVLRQNEVEDSGAFLGDKCYDTLGETDAIMEFNRGTISSSTMLCSWKDGYSFDEMQTKILDKAEECGIECVVASMSEIINEKVRSTKEINEYILNVLGVILATTIVMMICIQVTSILNNMSEYGILYANGFTTANIGIMLIVENVLKMIISCAVSLAIVKKLLTTLLYIIPEEQEVFNDIFNNNVIWGNIGAAAIMSLASLIIPLIFITRLKPVQLIGGNDT